MENKRIEIIEHIDITANHNEFRVYLIYDYITKQEKVLLKIFAWKNADQCKTKTEEEIWNKVKSWDEAVSFAHKIKENNYDIIKSKTVLTI